MVTEPPDVRVRPGDRRQARRRRRGRGRPTRGRPPTCSATRTARCASARSSTRWSPSTTTSRCTPYLAESITPNEDFTEFTIKVREGITFHDGTPLNADAVIDNLNRSFRQPPHRRRAVKDIARTSPIPAPTRQSADPVREDRRLHVHDLHRLERRSRRSRSRGRRSRIYLDRSGRPHRLADVAGRRRRRHGASRPTPSAPARSSSRATRPATA